MPDLPEINLYGPHWRQCGPWYYRGHALRGEAVFHPTDLPDTTQTEDFARLCRELNGSFALLYRDDNRLLAGVDRCRSLPLFYSPGLVTDQPAAAGQLPDPRLLADNCWPDLEFLPGRRTIFPATESLYPAEYLSVDEKGLRIAAYHRHDLDKASSAGLTELSRELAGHLRTAAARAIRLSGGRPLTVLLSAGYDSRILLAALCEQLSGEKRPAALTYGLPGGSIDRRTAEVCEQLRVERTFVDYGDAGHAEFLAAHYPQLIRAGGNGQSVPQEQDFHAVGWAGKNGKLPEDSLLLPGICGDFQAGSFVPPFALRTARSRRKAEREAWLLSRLAGRMDGAEAARRYHGMLGEDSLPVNSSEREVVGWAERIFIRERVAKQTTTTLRGYDQLGYDYLLPLWDNDFIDFWRKVPLGLRRYQTLYRHCLREHFFLPAGIAYGDEPGRVLPNPTRRLRTLLPAGLANAVLPLTRTEDDDLMLPAVRTWAGRWVPTDRQAAAGTNEVLGWATGAEWQTNQGR